MKKWIAFLVSWLVLLSVAIVPTVKADDVGATVSAYIQWRLSVGDVENVSYTTLAHYSIDGYDYTDVVITYRSSGVDAMHVPLVRLSRMIGLQLWDIKLLSPIVGRPGTEKAYITVVKHRRGISRILIRGIYKDGVNVKIMYTPNTVPANTLQSLYGLRTISDTDMPHPSNSSIVSVAVSFYIPSSFKTEHSQEHCSAELVYLFDLPRDTLTGIGGTMPLFVPMLC